MNLDLKWLKAEPWATAYGGTFAFNTPMIYALGFIYLFTIGGLTGIILANASLDLAFHDKKYIHKFWVGIMDGIGNIQINHYRKKYLIYRLVIKLEYNIYNEKMLFLIKNNIGGNIKIVKKKYIFWIVNNKKEVIKIIKIFEK